MTRPTTPRMPAIISASPLQRIRFEAFMTCQVSLLLWNAGDALEACRMDDAEDQLGNRLRPPPLSPRLVHLTGSSNQVGGDLVQVATSKPGLEDMIVQVLATGVRRTDLHHVEEPSRTTARRSSAVTRPRFRPTSADAAYSGSNRSRPERRYGSTSHPWSKERSEEHTSELQSRFDLVCRLLLEKKKN